MQTLLVETADDDGLIALPSPDIKRAYTDKASAAEMTFAGQYLNLAGLVLLTLGMLNYLRVSGFTERATSGGLLQSALGIGLGLFLSSSGERLFRQGQRTYALSLLAAGIGILTVTTGAAHFYFGLLPVAVLAVANFAIVSWAGLAAIRYDSAAIAICMLGAEFLGPLIMGFGMDTAGVALAYLMAINLATTLVAYRKKWDGLLIGSLAGSYLLFFHQFGLSRPLLSLVFLSMTYALFLVSSNIFHFARKTASDFNLGLSMVNPMLFACVSYLVLLRLPNTAALAVYTTIALLHAALAAKAARIQGQGEAYLPLTQANLALAVLFSTAAVSFLTYISNDTRYFALVTFLWMAQAFVFLGLSRRLSDRLALLTRRGSYGALTLVSIQLAYVVPTMESPYLIELPATLALLAYFVCHERSEATREERMFSNLVLLSAATAGYHIFPLSSAPAIPGQAMVGTAGEFAKHVTPGLISIPAMLAGAALAPLLMLAYQRFPLTLVAYRYLAPLMACAVTVIACLQVWPYHPSSWSLVPMALLVASLTPLCLRRPELESERALGALLATALLLRASWVMSGGLPTDGVLMAVFTVFLLGQVSRRLGSLEQVVQGLGLLLGAISLLVPARYFIELASLAVIIVLYGLSAAQAAREQRMPLATGSATIAGVLCMKLTFACHGGPGSTLVWCLAGLGLLRLAAGLDRLALGLMFLAFLKSILFDANFSFGKAGGLELAVGLDLSSLALVAATIACYAQAARVTRAFPETRNYYTLFGLLVFAFHSTFVLFNVYGVLDTFQIILSGFWAAASLLFVAYGIHAENKLFRHFGLVVLVSCVAKIYAVDIWVLDAYNKTTTTLVLGTLLMVVSFLYQTNRARLEEDACPA